MEGGKGVLKISTLAICSAKIQKGNLHVCLSTPRKQSRNGGGSIRQPVAASSFRKDLIHVEISGLLIMVCSLFAVLFFFHGSSKSPAAGLAGAV